MYWGAGSMSAVAWSHVASPTLARACHDVTLLCQSPPPLSVACSLLPLFSTTLLRPSLNRPRPQGILQEADGIIISRGNLGLDCEPEKMALVQKTLIQVCCVRVLVPRCSVQGGGGEPRCGSSKESGRRLLGMGMWNLGDS